MTERDESIYTRARNALEAIQRKYDELVSATERFGIVIDEALASEQAAGAVNDQLVARLLRHRTAIADFMQVLETIAHDHLIRASDRITMIERAERGEAV